MAFNPALISSPLNTTNVLVAENDDHQIEVDLVLNPIAQAMAQAKEQMHIAMEAQHQETQLWLWAEKDWQSWRMEGSTVVVLDKESAVEAMEKVVEEIGMRYPQVSFLLYFFGIVHILT